MKYCVLSREEIDVLFVGKNFEGSCNNFNMKNFFIKNIRKRKKDATAKCQFTGCIASYCDECWIDINVRVTK